MSTVLSGEEIHRYHEHGYVIPRYRLSQGDLGTLRRGCDALIAAAPGTRPEHLMNPHMVAWASADNPFMAITRDAAILDMVEQILGADLVLWITRILCKPAGDGHEVPWHQDGQYWPIRPLGTCSVWIAIDAASRENGCMRFIPGSHKRRRLYRHRVIERDNVVLNQEVEPDQFDESLAVDVELEPGQVSLHDVRMIHGSLPNTSERRRAGLILRYFPASSHFDRGVRDPANPQKFAVSDQPLFLMRGTDRSGKNDFVHGHAMWTERLSNIRVHDADVSVAEGSTP